MPQPKNIVDMFNELKADIKAMLKKPTVTNASTELTDGTTLFYAEDTLAEGIAVFSDEAMTTATVDGTYTSNDGDTITVKDGKVESIVAKVEDNDDPLKVENADLKVQIENLKKQITNKDAELKNVQDNVKSIMDRVEDLSKSIPGDGDLKHKKGDPKNVVTKKLEARRQSRQIGQGE